MRADGYRRIVHVDMDAFYASVEQRDDPALRGRPVAVGGSPDGRGVVAAASYEARVHGVRSAMPSARALRLCPDLVFVRPRFAVYRAVSNAVRAIFAEFTDRIEPLSLDEAYLDVSDSDYAGGSATRIAAAIRARIRERTGLTASAGVSYNKFLAKLASDMDKPDGLHVIPPGRGAAVVAELPVRRFHGIGPATAARMQRLGIHTGADLRARGLDELAGAFGRAARHYHALARGIDERPVHAGRARKSVGAECTFDVDLDDPAAMQAELERLAGGVAERLDRLEHAGRTLTVKLRFSDFRTVTRSSTRAGGFRGHAEIAAALPDLLARGLAAGSRVRLLGVTVSNLDIPVGAQADLGLDDQGLDEQG